MDEGDYNTPLPGEKKFVNQPATSQGRAQAATTGRLDQAVKLAAGEEDVPAEAGAAWGYQTQARRVYIGRQRRCRW